MTGQQIFTAGSFVTLFPFMRNTFVGTFAGSHPLLLQPISVFLPALNLGVISLAGDRIYNQAVGGGSLEAGTTSRGICPNWPTIEKIFVSVESKHCIAQMSCLVFNLISAWDSFICAMMTLLTTRMSWDMDMLRRRWSCVPALLPSHIIAKRQYQKIQNSTSKFLTEPKRSDKKRTKILHDKK